MLRIKVTHFRYARADVMPLGKLSLNLSGSLAKAGLAAGLNRLITSLKTQVMPLI